MLRIEISETGAELTLWDQRSGRPEVRTIACKDACRNAVGSILQAAAEILDVCFADRCSLVQPRDHRPLDACVDLSKQECPALPRSSAALSGSGSIDQGLATRVQALTGVGLGLSAAVSVGMWIANETVTIDRTVDGKSQSFNQTLSVPAGIATGLTAGLAVLSIPIFYYLEKAKRVPPSAVDPSKASRPAGLIKCPISNLTSAGMPRRSRL